MLPSANPSRRLGDLQMRGESPEAILSHRDQPPQHGAFDHFELEMIGGTDAVGSTALATWMPGRFVGRLRRALPARGIAVAGGRLATASRAERSSVLPWGSSA